MAQQNLGENLAGQHECQISEGGESSLQKLYNNCKKEAGHDNFIPFDAFTKEHLPEDYRDFDLYGLIKATGDLAVQIGVKMVSPHRPKFWPKTTKPYPFSNNLGNVALRSGSGEITMLKYIDGCGYEAGGDIFNINGESFDAEYKMCPCEKCQDSNKPSNVWWEIFVHTAAHVVFDDIEANQTTCRLFFNKEDSDLVSIDKFCVDYMNLEEDRCVLKYVTCESLGDKLYQIEQSCYDFWNKVKNKYMNKPNNKLNFIVSHPHGCSKKVSIGEWIDNNKVGEYNKDYDWTMLTYTTNTCKGSSGARVYCVGYRLGHIHSGNKDSVTNCSGIGLYRK